jgi:hypothetical protein
LIFVPPQWREGEQMGRTPRKIDEKNSGKRGPKRRTKDAKREVLEPASQQAADTADEVQPVADVAQDGGNVVQSPRETAGEQPGDGQEAGDEALESDDGVGETHVAEATGQAAAAAAEQVAAGDAGALAQPETETAAALALRRFREHPTCCCGCGQKLSGPKKHFVQGHDGRAKKIIRRIMKGELPAGEAPTELILRHAEIKFITRSPEYHKVIDLWREMCGVANSRAAK